MTTGNKSETGVGYSTLYGDTAGGFAVLKDVPKTLVYSLSLYRNHVQDKEVIPQRVLTKPPSAELRPELERIRIPCPPMRCWTLSLVPMWKKAAPWRKSPRGDLSRPWLKRSFEWWTAIKSNAVGPGVKFYLPGLRQGLARTAMNTNAARAPGDRDLPPGPSARTGVCRSPIDIRGRHPELIRIDARSFSQFQVITMKLSRGGRGAKLRDRHRLDRLVR